MLHIRALSFLLILGGTQSVTALANERYPAAGRIMDVSPDDRVVLVRKGGGQELARYNMLLFPGDRFEFRGDAKVTADVNEKRIVIEPGSMNKEIPLRESGFFGTKDSQFLDTLSALLSRPRRNIPIQTLAKSGGNKRPTLEFDPLAPNGLQYVLPGTGSVALLWRGGAARLKVRSSAGESASDSGQFAWAILRLTDHPPYDVSAEGQALRWSIRVADRAPEPPWFDDAQPLGEARRVVRAAWLLQNGPPEWHVFALSEMAELAASGNFQARQLWTAARTGELFKELTK